MNYIRLATRNIFRNKRRTLITFLSIITSATAIIIFGGFISFSFEGLRESTIRTQLGHFQIAKSGYFDQGAGLTDNYLIDDPGLIEQQLSDIAQIQTITRRLSGSGLISTGDRTLSARLVGIMPDREEDFSSFEVTIEGTQLDDFTPDGCVIGKGLSKGLDATVGTNVTILSTTLSGVINAIDCTVVGVVRTGSKEYDNVYVKLQLPLLQRLFDTKKIEKLLILVDKTQNMPLIESRLIELIKNNPNIEYKKWSDLAEYYKNVVNLYTAIFNITAIVLGFVVFLSIANTMSMTVFERFREIGTLRAIGETRFGIVRLFMCEGVIIGIVGGFIGIAVGIGGAEIINASGGIPVPAPPGMSAGYNAYINIETTSLSYAFFTSVFAATLSSLYPAYMASRLDIVKSLYHV